MKSMMESSETFTAYATIDAGVYMFNNLVERLNINKSPIKRMVDEATGFTRSENIKAIKEAIIILTDIVEAKKVIEDDYSKDEQMIQKLKTMLDSYK